MRFKKCLDCQVEKSLDTFSPSKKNRDGRTSYCRPCMTVRSRASYRKRASEQGRIVREVEVLPAGFKRCGDCAEIMELNGFFRQKLAPQGRARYCKACAMTRIVAGRDRIHGSARDYHLRRRYGIDAARVQAMIDDQGGLCLLCRERKPEHVAHDHLTGAVRGVLCSCCNQGLGNFRDNVAFVRAAADYLERTTWQRTQVCRGVYRLTSPRPAVRPSPSSSAMQHLISSRRTASSLAQ